MIFNRNKNRIANWFNDNGCGWKRFLTVAIFSIVLSECLLCLAYKINLLNSNDREPDFFMNRYFNQKTERDKYYTDDRETIILVEAGNLNRRQLAELLKCLDSACPKVIGFDVMHRQEGTDAKSDSSLVAAIRDCGSRIVLPCYKYQKSLVRPFYFNYTGIDSSLFGSVIFDDPWYHRYEHEVFPTFACLVARKFLGTEVDTESLIVDYSPLGRSDIEFLEFYSDSIGPMFTKIESGNTPFELIGFKDRIVVVGTSNLEDDRIDMKFNVCYFSSFQDGEFINEVRKVNDCSIVPGSAVLAYQIRSFIDKKHSFKKSRKGENFVLSVFLLVVYMFLFYFPEFIEKCIKKEKNRMVFWTFIPLMKILILVVAEYLVLNSAGWICDLTMKMFDLSLLMASMFFVNCVNEVFDRIVDIKRKK